MPLSFAGRLDAVFAKKAINIFSITLLFSICAAQSPADYPNKVPGTCSSPTDFDCGDGKCINFNLVRNCINDCGNNADEQCGDNQILCDALIGTGCGKCVSNATATSDCLDRRYSRLCDEGIPSQPDLPLYKCVNTPNCVLLKWLNDGADDCGDFSDEDPCLQGFNCALKTTSSAQFTLCTCNGPYSANGTVWARPDPLLAAIPGQCKSKPLQFDCGNGECIDITKFRDCVPDCPNRSDESCWLGTTLCLDGCTCVPPTRPTAPTCPAGTIGTLEVATRSPTTATITARPSAVVTYVSTNSTVRVNERSATASSSTSRATVQSTTVAAATTTTTTTPITTTPTPSATSPTTTTTATVTAAVVTTASTTTAPASSTARVTSLPPLVTSDGSSATCAPYQYRCANGQCISEMFISDKQDDCSDQSDEVYCGRYLNCSGCAYSFTSHAWICGCPAIRDGICYPSSLPSECADMTNGNTPVASGVYSVMKPNCASSDINQCITQIRCDFDTPGGPWIVIQRRLNGAENFYRSWQQYKEGFGNRETGDFWQGNDFLSALTSRQGVTYTLLILLNSTNDQPIRASYDRFSVAAETQNYALTLGRATDGDDHMTGSRSRQFAAFDRDVGGCAARIQTGWWVNVACDNNGNLNGPIKSIQWPGPGHTATIRTTMMMIRASPGVPGPASVPSGTAAAPPVLVTRPTIPSGRTPGRSAAGRPCVVVSALVATVCSLLRVI